MTTTTTDPDPDLADLRRRLLRLVRQAHKLDRGSLLVLAGHVDDAIERTEADPDFTDLPDWI